MLYKRFLTLCGADSFFVIRITVTSLAALRTCYSCIVYCIHDVMLHGDVMVKASDLRPTGCQPSLLTASCCTTSRVMPMPFKSCCMVSIPFFHGLPGFLFVLLKFQCTACLGSLLSSICRMCPSHLSHSSH